MPQWCKYFTVIYNLSSYYDVIIIIIDNVWSGDVFTLSVQGPTTNLRILCRDFSHCVRQSIPFKTHHYIIFFDDILSREWRVIVHQVQTNYNGRPMLL